MTGTTVQHTVKNNLCCGCGVCKGICPKDCISWERHNGMYLPRIEESRCIQCGLCASVCPGLGHTYEPRETAKDTITGPVLASFNVWSRDEQLRHVSASGGVVSTMIRHLLQTEQYDGAFCLDSYDYREQLQTRLYTAKEVAASWSESNAPKSRYLPVSHEQAVSYMKRNREKRIILVGTSCAIRGLQEAVKKLKLSGENYLFIGLFCDQVFNYNVLSYFADKYARGTMLKALHFKNKESGGWPGDMKFYPEDAKPFYVPLAERAKAKAYFMPERCLYCVDKLNVRADIALGDNYTGQDDSPLGSNSVLIRTEAGMAAWTSVKELLEIRPVEPAQIQKAQWLDGRLNNLYFGELAAAGADVGLDLNQDVPREEPFGVFKNAHRHRLKQLRAGAVYDLRPEVIEKQIKQDNKKPNPVAGFIRRALGFVKHRLMR